MAREVEIESGQPDEELLSFEGVTVGYEGHDPVLRDVSFSLNKREIAGVVALDGRGKSTLIKCAAGLLVPSAGVVRYRGRDVYRMSYSADQAFRKKTAVVLEGGALLTNRSVIENVALPIRYHEGGTLDDALPLVQSLLTKVGFDENPNALPSQVSSRGRRLAAFARALVREPELVIVDRFFESLDAADLKRVMELVLELNAAEGTSFLIVGRMSPSIFQVAERVIVLEGGGVAGFDFKQGLYKDKRLKEAFEIGEDDATDTKSRKKPKRRPQASQTLPGLTSEAALRSESQSQSGRASLPAPPEPAKGKEPEKAKRPPSKTDRVDGPPDLPPEILKALGDSQPLDPKQSDSDMAVVIMDENDEADAERTITLDTEKAAAWIAEAQAREDARIEEEARQLESGSSDGTPPDKSKKNKKKPEDS